MRSVTSRSRGQGAAKIAALFGSASLLALASVSTAQAQPVEEILVTGSLILGAAAVGVPVTAVSANDFVETGNITASEMMRAIPSVDVATTTSSLVGGGTTGFGQDVAIHGISSSGGDPTTLMLINDKRWPVQGHGGDTVDPGLVPAIGIERIDILTSGSSERYGADAITGVMNLVMIRGFDGARTQVTGSVSPEVGRPTYLVGQLWGRSWDGGNFTIALENYDQRNMVASKRPYLTGNFIPYGWFDNTPLASSAPGIITTGDPIPVADMPARYEVTEGTRYCTNCFAIPHGTGWDYGDTNAHTDPSPDNPIPTTTWATLLANQFIPYQRNEQNQINTYEFVDALPHQHRFALWSSVDYDLTDDFFGLGPIAAYVNGFYNNRRATTAVPLNIGGSGNSAEHLSALQANGMPVPTFGDECLDQFQNDIVDTYGNPVAGDLCTTTANPYYPAGAPGGLHAHYVFSPEFGYKAATIVAAIIESRYELGLRFNALPFDWVGDAYSSMSEERNTTLTKNMISQNHVAAALGWTVPEGNGVGEKQYAKPADVPYLNVFCDQLVYECNSRATLDYISGIRLQANRWKIREYGANFSGPIFELPGGMIQGGVGINYLSHHYQFTDFNDVRVHSKAVPNMQADYAQQQSESYFGQLNIPLVGPGFNFPLMEALNIELGYRFDKFNFQEAWVKTPKVAADWIVGWGLTLRGAWGESYRTPSFGQRSAASGSRAIGANVLGGGGNEFFFDCSNQFNVPAPPAAGIAPAGSPTAILNPECRTGVGNQEFEVPAGITLNGGSGLADPARGLGLDVLNGVPFRTPGAPGKGLNPETSSQYTLGFNWTPEGGMLQGLYVDASYYYIKINDTVTSAGFGGGDVNNPLSIDGIIIRPTTRADPYALVDGNGVPLDTFHPDNADFLKIIRDLQATGSATFQPIFIKDQKFIWDGANTNLGFVTFEGIDYNIRYDWDMGNYGSFNIGTSGSYDIDSTEKAGPLAPVLSDFEGENSGGRLVSARYRLGWNDAMGTWGSTLFATYFPHSGPNTNIRLPDCFWRAGNGPGSCYPGSPFYPQPAGASVYYNGAPAFVSWDLNIRYNTGMLPTNEYLQNINVSFTIQNILDRDPSQQLESRSREREMRAYDRRWSELQRTVVLTITKEW